MEKKSKRSLSETSPDSVLDQSNKRRVMATNKEDLFLWSVFESKMSQLLENVAKKEDVYVYAVQHNLNEIRL